MADSDTNDFEQFITARIDFTTGTPPVGNSGDFEQWITDRIDLAEYVEAAVVVGQPMMLRGTTVPHIRQWQPQRFGR